MNAKNQKGSGRSGLFYLNESSNLYGHEQKRRFTSFRLFELVTFAGLCVALVISITSERGKNEVIKGKDEIIIAKDQVIRTKNQLIDELSAMLERKLPMPLDSFGKRVEQLVEQSSGIDVEVSGTRYYTGADQFQLFIRWQEVTTQQLTETSLQFSRTDEHIYSSEIFLKPFSTTDGDGLTKGLVIKVNVTPNSPSVTEQPVRQVSP